MTLIELLIGLTIGLLVIVAALGTLVLSRAVSGVVSEISQLQQQGSFAMRVIGMQFRQTGSIEPNRDEPSGLYAFAGAPSDADAARAALRGADGEGTRSDRVSIVTTQAESLVDQLRDCLGNKVAANEIMDATFATDGAGQLTCASQGMNASLVGNVADFQVNYRVQADDAWRIMTASEIDAEARWDAVKAIEICLDLQGSENIPDGATPYKGCDEADRPRNGHTHLVFRNVFDLRTKER